MWKIEKDVRAYALDELREFLIYNNVTISDKNDLMKTYLKMHREGYYYKAEVNEVWADVKKFLRSFAETYEQDHDILEKDLIFFGSKKVLEKIDKKNIR